MQEESYLLIARDSRAELPMRTCIGTLGLECDIEPEGNIVYIGNGLEFKRRMRALCDSYLRFITYHGSK
ncbi:hypothetical protein KP509_1Z250100 [Ceratopteris richardii]|nr:hypothetical protein KP509_1Z250100 [Ceratopteris richardii]